jgi:hypothetical protein
MDPMFVPARVIAPMITRAMIQRTKRLSFYDTFSTNQCVRRNVRGLKYEEGFHD